MTLSTSRRWSVAALVVLLMTGVGLLLPAWAPFGQTMRSAKLVWFELSLLALVAGGLRFGLLRGFVWWALVGLLVAYHATALVTVWRVLLAALAIDTLGRKLTDPKDLLTGWRWLTVLHTSYMLLQACGLDPIYHLMPGQAQPHALVTGALDSDGLAGAYTAITLPLFFAGKWRGWLVPSVLAIFATHAFGAVVVATVLLGVACWQAAPRPMRLGSVLVLLPLLLLTYGQMVEPLGAKLRGERTNRLAVWSESVRIANMTPRSQWLGYGPGQFAFTFHGKSTLHPDYHWDWAHNEPVQLLVEFGRVGLLLAAAGAFVWLMVGWWSHRAPVNTVAQMFLGFLLTCGYTAPLHVASLAVVGVLLAGILEAERRALDADPA